MSTTIDNSERQAIAQLESIREMVANLSSEDSEVRDNAMEQIQEDPLSIEVRSDWHAIGEVHVEPTEYQILLCTGGPACRIEGELNSHLEPCTARLMHQDWGTPWTEYSRDTHQEREADEQVLLAYARQFCFEC